MAKAPRGKNFPSSYGPIVKVKKTVHQISIKKLIERPSGSIIPSPSLDTMFPPSVQLASMTQSLEEDLWALAFSNVGRNDDHERSNSDDVAQASYTIWAGASRRK